MNLLCSQTKGRAEWSCLRTKHRNGMWMILYLSSVRPRFSISLVTSAISSFSLWEQTERRSFTTVEQKTNDLFIGSEWSLDPSQMLLFTINHRFRECAADQHHPLKLPKVAAAASVPTSDRTLDFSLHRILSGVSSTCSGVSSHHPLSCLHLSWPRYITPLTRCSKRPAEC